MADVISYIILGILLLIMAGGIALYVFKSKKQDDKSNDNINVNDLKLNNLDEKIINLTESLNTFKNVSHQTDLKRTEQLTKTVNSLQNNHHSINELKSNIQDIQSIFYSSKNRGNLGEYSLYTIIEDFLGAPNGKNWDKQVKMKIETNNSGIGNPDAIIYNGYKNIIIDSKFPLDNYKKYQNAAEASIVKDELEKYKKLFENDLKDKIKEIKKYKKSDDNNILIMFIPSEAIFSFIMSNFQSIVIHNENVVNFCSPTTLSLMLRLILEDEKKQHLIENAETIRKQIVGIADEYRRLNERWVKVKDQLVKTQKSAKELDTTFLKIETKTQKIDKPDKGNLLK